MRDSYVREIVWKLKQDLVARAGQSRLLHAEARALRGVERHKKQMERRAFGRSTRWVLLAYAWLRRRPYARAEPRAVVPVPPYAVRHVLNALGITVEASAIARWLRAESPGFEELVEGRALALSA